MPETGLGSVPQGGPLLKNPRDIRALVLKLRWIGLEDEANGLTAYLTGIAPGAVLIDPAATD
jgi:hypothetical protein